jgi:ribosomal-protein-alanine N-acetyltransferase
MSAVLKPRISFRPMLEEDLPAVIEIERAAYEFPWSENVFRDCLRVGYCCWVLERDALIQAYGVMSVGAGESHILNLCVRPDSQGQGLGSTMLHYLLDLARKHRADTAFLEVRPSNGAALRLYNRAGFTEVGMRRRYYPATGGREDALILARSLLT